MTTIHILDTEDQYDTLVLSGGSVNGITLLGSLQYLYDNDKLNHIKNYYATSVGTIISYLLILGYKPIEILLKIISEKVLDNFKKINILKLARGNGGFEWQNIEDFLIELTLTKCEQPMSFQDIYDRYGIKFICCTYNLSLQKLEYMSVDTHPKLLCTSAIRMSANIPLLFSRYKFKNNYYIDGGLADNFPIGIVPNNSIVLGLNLAIVQLDEKIVQNKSKTQKAHDVSDVEQQNTTPPHNTIALNTELNADIEVNELKTEMKTNTDAEASKLNTNEEVNAKLDTEVSESINSHDDKTENSPDKIIDEIDSDVEGADEIDENINMSLQDYIIQSVTTPLTFHVQDKIDKFINSQKELPGKSVIITIPTIKVAINFNIDTHDQLELFSHGYQYLKTHSSE